MLFFVVVKAALQSPMLVLGVVFWAGSPTLYARRRRVFVQSQLTAQDAAKIAGVKRWVGLLSLTGAALIVASTMTSKTAGLTLLGADPETAVTTKLDELGETSDDVSRILEQSKSFAYVFDLSSWQLLVDLLAKLLVVTAVFGDLVLRATLAAWRNDRSLRAHAGASDYDASAAAAEAALAPGAPPAA